MKVFVLLTAMPPTTGHLQLLQFANNIAEGGVVAVINTQPHEPFPTERARSLRKAIKRLGLSRRIKLIHYNKIDGAKSYSTRILGHVAIDDV